MARPRRLYRSATAREKCRRIFRAQALPMWTRSSRDRPRRRDHSLLPLDDVPLRVVRLVHESGVIDRADGRNAKLRGAAPECRVELCPARHRKGGSFIN